jgi:hypothetical protein
MCPNIRCDGMNFFLMGTKHPLITNAKGCVITHTKRAKAPEYGNGNRRPHALVELRRCRSRPKSLHRPSHQGTASQVAPTQAHSIAEGAFGKYMAAVFRISIPFLCKKKATFALLSLRAIVIQKCSFDAGWSLC